MVLFPRPSLPPGFPSNQKTICDDNETMQNVIFNNPIPAKAKAETYLDYDVDLNPVLITAGEVDTLVLSSRLVEKQLNVDMPPT